MTAIRTTNGTTYGQLSVGQDIWVGGKHGIVTEVIVDGELREIIVRHTDEEVSLVGRTSTRTMRRPVRR
jgi:hypothetical protein